jgi:hypothetical protein
MLSTLQWYQLSLLSFLAFDFALERFRLKNSFEFLERSSSEPVLLWQLWKYKKSAHASLSPSIAASFCLRILAILAFFILSFLASFLILLHGWHRFGSWISFFSRKNCCSPAEKIQFLLQSYIWFRIPNKNWIIFYLYLLCKSAFYLRNFD